MFSVVPGGKPRRVQPEWDSLLSGGSPRGCRQEAAPPGRDPRISPCRLSTRVEAAVGNGFDGRQRPQIDRHGVKIGFRECCRRDLRRHDRSQARQHRAAQPPTKSRPDASADAAAVDEASPHRDFGLHGRVKGATVRVLAGFCGNVAPRRVRRDAA
jgi:hypothetical protein